MISSISILYLLQLYITRSGSYRATGKQTELVNRSGRSFLKSAFFANRRRVCRKKGRCLIRLQSERVERTFAQVCQTGESRRIWLRDIEKVHSIHVIKCAAYNLEVLMRVLFKMPKPRSGSWTWLFSPSKGAQELFEVLAVCLEALKLQWCRWMGAIYSF